MTQGASRRGGATVGLLEDLSPVELGAVMYLRQWCDGPEGRSQVNRGLSDQLGDGLGQETVRVFEQLCNLCARHGRRPLMRHHVHCKCLGADEACFANFIGYASEGAREDAMMIATIMVRPDMAPVLAGLAEEFGMALRSTTLKNRPLAPPMGATVH